MKKAREAKVAKLERKPNSVFVSVQPPEPVQHVQAASRYFRDWTSTATDIVTDTTPEANPQTHQPDTNPTADDLLQAHLPHHISESRWALYVTPCGKCRVFDGTTFIHHNPHPPFWNLYNLAKGIFRDLGISLSKQNGVWEARIPIRVLTDKVFVESGLAGVEATLRTRKDTDSSLASKMSDSIRHRQFSDTQRGMAKVKQMREGLADAAGVMAIAGVSWFAYIVMGGVV